MNQKAEAQELASRYLQALRAKLSDPEITLLDLASAFEKLFTVYLILEGKPVDRKELIIKVQGAQGEVSEEYRVAIKQILQELVDLSE